MNRILGSGILAGALAGLCCAQTETVAIFVDFEQSPSEASVAEMKREVADLLRPSGVVLDWRLLEKNRGTEAFADLAVMRFRGRCRADRDPAIPVEEHGRATLGSTWISEGHILPFGQVQCDQIRRSIAEAGAGPRDSLLGRAMGRVVAHELFHVLAKTTSHARHGLTKSCYTGTELTTKNFSLEEGGRAARSRRRDHRQQ